MDARLKSVMEEYVKDVEDLCNNLLRGINVAENLDLKTKREFLEYVIEKWKREFEVKGVHYYLHGGGCTASAEGMYMNWDFGYRSRWCGIDPLELAFTLKKNNSQDKKFHNGEFIKRECEQAVLDGEMFAYKNKYYFVEPDCHKFKPEFPKEYDTLIIEHFDERWSVTRNKVIDKFIRKSQSVSSKIGERIDKYKLLFMLEGKEVYTIYYDEIGYPENAIKIMSDDIITKLRKEKLEVLK